MWAPIDFAALAWLPRPGDRPYTKTEALLALQADYWYCRPASVTGFSEQWGWHRRRVRDFMSEVGVEIVGQVGRRPGKLRPSCGPATARQVFQDFGQIGDSENKSGPAKREKMEMWSNNCTANGPTNGLATARQVFQDFGQIGDSENKSGPANGPANVSEVAHTYQQDIENEQNTTPHTPPRARQVAGDGQIKEYVRLAEMNGKAKDPVGLERYLLSRGLTPSHLQQLQDWKTAAEEKRRRIYEIDLQTEKKKREQEKERERAEVALASFLALPEEAQERLTSDFLSTLPGEQRREYDPQKDKWQANLKYWLSEKLSPQKIGGEVTQ